MKTIFILLYLLVFYFLLSSVASANGGVIDASYFKKTGNIRLLQQADISLLKEDLNIRIINDTTFIEVVYVLKNNGKNQKIHYGFPIDIYHSTEKKPILPQSLFYFEAFINQKKQTHSFWKQEKLYRTNDSQGSEVFRDFIDRWWNGLAIDFEENETQTLTINYAVQNKKMCYFSGFNFFPSCNNQRFIYDLFPSSSWGDGLVRDFNLKIDVQDLENYESDYKIEGIENLVQTQSGVYTLSQKDFDLKKRSFILVEYQNKKRVIGQSFTHSYKKFAIESIVSSAPNAVYLTDNNPNTVWKGKEGDWILIKIKQPTEKKIYVDNFVFLNGDYSSQTAFQNTGKVKAINIKINDFPLFRPYYNPKTKKTHYFTNFEFEESIWFLEDKNSFSVVQCPIREQIPYVMKEYFEKHLDNYTDNYYIETIAIYITKSSLRNKEVAISDLFVLSK